MTQRIANPFPLFLDRYGRPLTGGKVYVGEAGEDPELLPVAAFYDAELSLAAAQPINVIGGLTTRDGNPSLVFCEEDQYSIRVRDADGAEVFYVANAVMEGDLFQPLNAALTAIAALATTAYGRSLLTQADAADLRDYAGIVDPLPIAGGTMLGDIKRTGAGAFPYVMNAEYQGCRIFVTASGAADPRTEVGDIWLEQEA